MLLAHAPTLTVPACSAASLLKDHHVPTVTGLQIQTALTADCEVPFPTYLAPSDTPTTSMPASHSTCMEQ